MRADLCKCCGDLRPLRAIHGDCQRVTTRGSQLLDGTIEPRRIDIQQGDRGAVTSQPLAGRASDAACAPRNHGDFARKRPLHSVPPRAKPALYSTRLAAPNLPPFGS
jgi:hypothetical protein